MNFRAAVISDGKTYVRLVADVRPEAVLEGEAEAGWHIELRLFGRFCWL